MLSLFLFHGQVDNSETLNDWGCDGPLLGPFTSILTTYAKKIRVDEQDASKYLTMCGDTVYYDGVYYGCWSVISSERVETDPYFRSRRREAFDPEKAKLPRSEEAEG